MRGRSSVGIETPARAADERAGSLRTPLLPQLLDEELGEGPPWPW